jgi:hypothetical protein
MRHLIGCYALPNSDLIGDPLLLHDRCTPSQLPKQIGAMVLCHETFLQHRKFRNGVSNTLRNSRRNRGLKHMRNPKLNEKAGQGRSRHGTLRLSIVLLVTVAALLTAYAASYSYHHVPAVHWEMDQAAKG